MSEPKKLCYLAGPMRGIESDNYPAFNAAAASLRSRGWKIYNPAEIDGGSHDRPREWYLTENLKALEELCCEIILLPGWRESEGVAKELEKALELGFPVYLYREGVNPIPLLMVCDSSAEDAEIAEALQDATCDSLGRLTQEHVDSLAPSETYLEEAHRIVHGARQASYGHPRDNHGCTAAIWSAWLNRKCGTQIELTAQDVCWLNVLQKASRDANAPKRDNRVDAIGFMLNIEMAEEPEVTKSSL